MLKRDKSGTNYEIDKGEMMRKGNGKLGKGEGKVKERRRV